MTKLNFKQLQDDPCLYKRCDDDGIECLIGVFVDDLAVASNSSDCIKDLKDKLAEHYKINDYGNLKEFLGYEITRDKSSRIISLSQIKHVRKIVEKFMTHITISNRATHTPIIDGDELHNEETNENSEPYSGDDYRAAVGSLLYVSGGTRPDIAYAVHKVSQFCNAPKVKHWNAVLRIINYLSRTPDLGITLGGDITPGLLCYVDANHTGAISYKRSAKSGLYLGGNSTTGYIFYLGQSPVSWKSKKQLRFTATSSSEAEVIALVDATKESSWLSRLCANLCKDYPRNKPVKILEENTSCLSIVTRGVLSERTKHFRVDYYYVTSEVEQGHIKIDHCPTKSMIADTFTKALPRQDFEKFRATFMTPVTLKEDSESS